MPNAVLDFLARRRSVLVKNLGDPGPGDEEIETILKIASRVPDHKKLVPWRFIIFQGDARQRFGQVLAEACALEEENEPSPKRLDIERGRFDRAPVIIAVVARLNARPSVPEWEQTLSVGAACQNLVLAANGLGYSSQWITEWYAYNPVVCAAMGLRENEKIAGFIYIGTAVEPPTERDRPELSDIVTRWV